MSVRAGTWGDEPLGDGSDVFCVRAADFDRQRFRVKPDKLPLRSVDPRLVSELRLLRGDIVLEKSGGGADQPVGGAALYDLDLPAICSNFAARLRAETHVDPRYLNYLLAALYFAGVTAALAKQTTGIANLDVGAFLATRCQLPDLPGQRVVADYLDSELAALDDLVNEKRKLVDLLQERIDAAIMILVGQSALVDGGERMRGVPIRRRLMKMNRPPEPAGDVVTAFRDGQVTARSFRRSEGYTESWTEGARVQGVKRGDVVVHGLDGFAGAIGTSEAVGVCSPIYHVCRPIDGGDSDFYGRMLRLLATTGYLGNFATSTRERAVDFRNWDLFGRIPIPVVATADQLVIGERIRRLAPVRELVARSEMLINERKQALIAAAVSGQVGVPGVAA